MDDQGWQCFSRWARSETVKAQGIRPTRIIALNDSLRREWTSRGDKNEYLRCIRRDEEYSAKVADCRDEINSDFESHTRYTRRAILRRKAVSLKAYARNLKRLIRIEKNRDARGRTISSAALRRYHDRSLQEAEDEIASSKAVAVQEATDQLCSSTLDPCPAALRSYVTAAYEQLPWADIHDEEYTDRHIFLQMRTDILTSERYKDTGVLDWDNLADPEQLMDTARDKGNVRCNGHDYHQYDGDEMKAGTLDWLSQQWEEYLHDFESIRPLQRPVPIWVIRAAKSRAEMMYDHDNDKAIYQPEPDHSDLLTVLQDLTQAEEDYYQNLAVKLWHCEIEITVDDYLRPNETLHALGEGPHARPRPPPASRATLEANETQRMLDDGRRALQHIWESRIRHLTQQGGPDEQVEALFKLYRRALVRFDMGSFGYDDGEPRGRQWLSPEYASQLATPVEMQEAGLDGM